MPLGSIANRSRGEEPCTNACAGKSPVKGDKMT